MTDWKWNGSRWWKCDFHTHTPASEDYGKGADQSNLKQRTPREWLFDYMKADIDCVAVTDHNSGAWIDELKTEYARMETEQLGGFRPMHLFPGVEISVHGGIHILAILDKDKGTSDIDTLLGAVDYSGTKGSCASVTTKSLIEVAAEIVKRGGIAIPAHADENNGLFKLAGQTLQQSLDCEQFVAMELIDAKYRKPAAYASCKRPWIEVVGSDAHHPTGEPEQKYPGSRFTWIKMGTPSIEGLRLALLDGPLSVIRSDAITLDPNQHADMAMEYIEVNNARYIGRPSAFSVNLNPWMNAVIGGRGTGKSTIVEFLRLILRRDKELPETLQKDFAKYFEVYASRDEDGLLRGDSRFAVVYRKNGARYRVQWSQRGDVEPIEAEQADGSWRAEPGEIAQRFPVRIYSQKQIYELAKAPLALLKIVDESPEVDRRSWENEWKAEESRFLSLRAKAREIEAGLSDERGLQGELKDVQHKLAVFEQAGHADILKGYQRRLRQQRAVEEWKKSWAGAGERIRGIAQEITPDPMDSASFDQDNPEEKDFLEKVSNVLNEIQQVRDDLEKSASKLDGILSKWSSEQERSPWAQAVKKAIEAYEQLRIKLAKEAAGDPSAYGELVQRRQMLEARLKEFESRKKQLDSIQKEAQHSLTRLLEMRRCLTSRRKAFLTRVLEGNPYVRIEVVSYDARETVEEAFRRLVQRDSGGFEKDIGKVDNGEGLLGGLYSETPGAVNFESRLAQLKQTVKAIAAGNATTWSVRDQRFATHLGKLPPETFDRLDLWFPEDSLRVEYSTLGDGSGFRSIQEGSPGQKTAALLAFLLSYGKEPIVLDQPEDDLDNHLIYDLIVTQLRNIKQRRQVIVVTHNANIVVNGDAELVVALRARNGQTQIETGGSLQEKAVRKTICEVMEGGEKAFEQRYRRIALEVRSVR
jgi:energy-coupling factor transporter ATP-binding protein EcfA2